MEKQANKLRLARIPAWALSLMTLVALGILMGLLEDPKSTGFSTIQIIGYTFFVILNAIACFIICRTHPESVWYTPVICNVVGIFAILMYVFTNLSTLSELILWVSSIVLSMTGAIIGARIGRRRINQVN